MYQQRITHNNPKINISLSTNLSKKTAVYSQMHFHSSLEFLYIQQGSFLCHVGGDDIFVTEGEILFINSRTPHSTETVTADEMFCVMLQFENPLNTPENTSYFSLFTEQNDRPYFVFKAGDANTGMLGKLIMDMYHEQKAVNIAYEYVMMAKRLEIIALLFREELLCDYNTEPVCEKRKQRIMPIVQFIEENYSSMLSLEQLSKTLHMNKNYICKLFKDTTSRTVMDYLNFVRIQHGKELIKTGLSISEVSSAVGYSSQSYFDKVFQKYILCTPTEYRKRFLNNTLNNL